MTFTKDCQPLYADAKELNNEVQVNFKLNLKHIQVHCEGQIVGTQMGMRICQQYLCITLFATGSIQGCFGMCFNSSMCFFSIPMPFILEIQLNGRKRKKNPCLCWLYTGQKKWQELSMGCCHSKDKMLWADAAAASNILFIVACNM